MVDSIWIKWMVGANFFIHQVDLLIKDTGKMVNSKDMANYSTNFQNISKHLTTKISLKYIIVRIQKYLICRVTLLNKHKLTMDTGNTMREIWSKIWNKDMECLFLKMDRNMMDNFIMIWCMAMAPIMVRRKL